MQKNIHNYFTTGELSQLCKIPRKTLLYYDKMGLIKPEVIDENGYRYYKRSQLFSLQLILTLRQLEIPLAQIKEYLANRSLAAYNDLFSERIDFFTREIARLTAMKDDLKKEQHALDEIADIKLDTIYIKKMPVQYLYVSNATKAQECFKKRSTHIANMFTKLQKSVPVTTNSFGYIYDAKILEDFDPQHINHYFYTLKSAINSEHCHQKPPGEYVTLCFQGVYMFNNKKYLQMLADYCKKHKLTPLSPLYVTSICDYWTTGDMEKYVYKLEIRVK